MQATVGQAARWTNEVELLAQVVDRLSLVITWLQAVAGVEHPDELPLTERPAELLDHVEGEPAELATPPQMSSAAEIKAFFAGAIHVIPDN